jgi:hypothetical protein
MFNSKNSVITKVFNPLNITGGSMIEFYQGDLRDTGLYRFNLIVECTVKDMTYSKYVIFSKTEGTEYVFEVFPSNGDAEPDTTLYRLVETIPFSEDFLAIAGQKYLTAPDATEYERSTMPGNDERIDGISGKARVYNVETGKVESEFGFKLWQYERDRDGIPELLELEMSEEDGMFKIFTGEVLEDIFYKFYKTSNE